MVAPPILSGVKRTVRGVPYSGERMKLERFARVEEMRSEWDVLAAAAGNPFATSAWAETWLAHSDEDVRTFFFRVAPAAGAGAVILPLVVAGGRRVRRLRFLGFGAGSELGPISAPADRAHAAAALAEAFRVTRGEWDVFLGDHLPGVGWGDLLGGRSSRREAPTAQGPWPSWEVYLASRSANLRQELRRKERRLADRGLRYLTVADPDELEGALDRLFELHRARWSTEASRFAAQEPFHRSFASIALARGWLRLRLLELEGRPVAAYYGFRFGEVEWFYQLGRDPAATGSVGLMLLARALREAIEESAAEFKLGPGAQSYKTRFATVDPGLETVTLARSVRGRVALLAARLRP
jgi:CelD/BcsL family acetyltransferase involved in cellulose biosynthesis